MRVVVRAETWPIAGGFRIARGRKTNAEVIVVEIEHDGAIGRAECVPYARYGESTASVRASVERALVDLEPPPEREGIVATMPPGAARNAVDCALWDLEAWRVGRPVWALLGFDAPPDEVATMRTVSIDTPQAMAAVASTLASAPMLKVKLDGGATLDRLRAVHASAPETPLVVDANESWTVGELERWLPSLASLNVVLLEQPLPTGKDEALASLRGEVAFCADESFHDRMSFERIAGRYDVVNVKLDKAGGLSEATAIVRDAKALGLQTMLGCMVSTSLAIAPSLLLSQSADFIDLDGPLLLEADRPFVEHDRARSILRRSPDLWGGQE